MQAPSPRLFIERSSSYLNCEGNQVQESDSGILDYSMMINCIRRLRDKSEEVKAKTLYVKMDYKTYSGLCSANFTQRILMALAVMLKI